MMPSICKVVLDDEGTLLFLYDHFDISAHMGAQRFPHNAKVLRFRAGVWGLVGMLRCDQCKVPPLPPDRSSRGSTRTS
jgi:hypothetical protein